MSQIEQDFWKKTVIVLSIVSIIVGLVQRTQYRFLDPIFEFFIFSTFAYLQPAHPAMPIANPNVAVSQP